VGQQPAVLTSENIAASQQIDMTNNMKKQFLSKILVLLQKNKGDAGSSSPV
jgi:hypothetical protein